MNAREGQQMLDAANKNKKKLVIGFQYRFGSNATFLRQAVEAGTFGNILYARSQALRRRGIPNWGVFGRKELQGGGPLIDIGVHILEVTHFVMGSPRPVAANGQTWTYMGNKKSSTVSAWPNWDHKTYTVEDLAVGQIRFENGAVLNLESSFIAHIEKDAFAFSIMGEKGGANWDPPAIFKDDAGYMVNQTPAYLAPSGFTDHFQAKMRNFVDHALYNKPTLAPAEHGLMVQKMLDGIYESAAKGKEVAIS
jgi:predicted dehydrogenase